MSETLDVTQIYIKNLENKVTELVKSTIILETNLGYVNTIIEQKVQQIDDLNRKNYEFNETVGNIQSNHQNEINELKKLYEDKISNLHYEAMKEVEKTHKEKNEMHQTFNNIIQDLTVQLEIEKNNNKDLNLQLQNFIEASKSKYEENTITFSEPILKKTNKKNKKEDLSF